MESLPQAAMICRMPQVAFFYLGVLVFSQSRAPSTGGVFSGSAEGAQAGEY